jgi:hypothetical protein
MVNYNINLDDIPSGNIYLRIKKGYVQKISHLIRKSNTLLPVEIKQKIYNMERGQKVSLAFIKKISLNLDIPMHEIEKNIERITSLKSTEVGIRNPNFPICFSSIDGARFIAGIMGDGEMNKVMQIRYNNQNTYLINLILKSAKRIFGDIDYKLYYRKDKTYQLHFPKISGLITTLVGIKPGFKTITDNPIPECILKNKNKNIKFAFVRQFFNDEGNVRLKDRRLQVKQTVKVNVSKEEAKKEILNYAPKVLIGLQNMLDCLGIDSKISLGAYRKDRIDCELSFYRIENLKIFQKYIGFDIDYKNLNLDKAIKSYKFPSAARNKKLEFAIESAKRVEKKYGFFNKDLLSKECKRSLKTATYYIVELKKRNMIRCIEIPRRKDGREMANKYKIIS